MKDSNIYETIKTHCLSLRGAALEFPYNEHVPTFRIMGKIFALFTSKRPLKLGIKYPPELSEELKGQYSSVESGYFNMFKKHWITIKLDGSIPEKELLNMIDMSYQLVFNGLRKSDQKLIKQQ